MNDVRITTKELSSLSDLLGMEANLVAKYRQYATDTNDATLKSLFEQTANKHQRHLDELWTNLK
jgi:rubrerythrin